jgi:heterodisulfide reductase subunit B
LINDIGLERIVALQTHSIADFRPACYYGCQIVRPYGAIDEDPELPMYMDRMFTALGAKPVDYPPKVRCCGGMLVATFPDVAEQLCTELVEWAVEGGANCIVTVCPLCQANLDLLSVNTSTNGNGNKIPIMYFTQLLGLALGCSEAEVGLKHGLVPVKIEAPRLSATMAGAPSGRGDLT